MPSSIPVPSSRSMKISDFDFFLPEGLIAARPCRERDSSRLLVLQRDGLLEHKRFSDLPAYLSPGDMLLMNNTRVFPARLSGYKQTGGRVELLMVREISDGLWSVLSRDRYSGRLMIAGEIPVEVTDGTQVRFSPGTDVMGLLWKYGSMPLPPYIKRQPDFLDRETYQTVYADVEGSIAAPTAGLHFTPGLLDVLRRQGVLVTFLTLHVGAGTFRPVRVENLEDHRMETEHFEISAAVLGEIARVKSEGKKVVAVGTTTTRAIEGCLSGRCVVASRNGTVRGTTDIFIREGHRFNAVDSLITNFHLPGSTPLILAAALAGREKLLSAYESAVASAYRFFSYGDAMLVL